VSAYRGAGDSERMLDTPLKDGTLVFARVAAISMVQLGPYGNAPSFSWLSHCLLSKDGKSMEPNTVKSYFARSHRAIVELTQALWFSVYDKSASPVPELQGAGSRLLMFAYPCSFALWWQAPCIMMGLLMLQGTGMLRHPLPVMECTPQQAQVGSGSSKLVCSPSWCVGSMRAACAPLCPSMLQGRELPRRPLTEMATVPLVPRCTLMKCSPAPPRQAQVGVGVLQAGVWYYGSSLPPMLLCVLVASARHVALYAQGEKTTLLEPTQASSADQSGALAPQVGVTEPLLTLWAVVTLWR
jgi:hypothetical protein